MYVAWSLCEQTGISGSRTRTLKSPPKRSESSPVFVTMRFFGVGLGLDVNISTFHSAN
jgi:hypothetical protein